MTDRPTPEQVIIGSYLHDCDCSGPEVEDILARLRAAGYRVVHPDDHAKQMDRRRDSWSDAQYWYASGEEAMWEAVFGDG